MPSTSKRRKRDAVLPSVRCSVCHRQKKSRKFADVVGIESNGNDGMGVCRKCVIVREEHRYQMRCAAERFMKLSIRQWMVNARTSNDQSFCRYLRRMAELKYVNDQTLRSLRRTIEEACQYNHAQLDEELLGVLRVNLQRKERNFPVGYDVDAYQIWKHMTDTRNDYLYGAHAMIYAEAAEKMMQEGE